MILPAGWGLPFWRSLMFAGARAIGQSLSLSLHVYVDGEPGWFDWERIQSEAGRLVFPRDFPDTVSHATYMSEIASQKVMDLFALFLCNNSFFFFPTSPAMIVLSRTTERESLPQEAEYNRRPPSKRPNYTLLGVPSPFVPAWTPLLSIHPSPAPAPPPPPPTSSSSTSPLPSPPVVPQPLPYCVRYKQSVHAILFPSSPPPPPPSATSSVNMKWMPKYSTPTSPSPLLPLSPHDDRTLLPVVGTLSLSVCMYVYGAISYLVPTRSSGAALRHAGIQRDTLRAYAGRLSGVCPLRQQIPRPGRTFLEGPLLRSTIFFSLVSV